MPRVPVGRGRRSTLLTGPGPRIVVPTGNLGDQGRYLFLQKTTTRPTTVTGLPSPPRGVSVRPRDIPRVRIHPRPDLPAQPTSPRQNLQDLYRTDDRGREGGGVSRSGKGPGSHYYGYTTLDYRSRLSPRLLPPRRVVLRDPRCTPSTPPPVGPPGSYVEDSTSGTRSGVLRDDGRHPPCASRDQTLTAGVPLARVDTVRGGPRADPGLGQTGQQRVLLPDPGMA